MNKTINSSMRTSVRRGEMKMEIEKGQYIEEPWEIIQSYFRDRHLDRLVRHQLESYNNFVTQQILKLLKCLTQSVLRQKMILTQLLEDML